MTEEARIALKRRLIKAGYIPGFDLEEALDKFQPDETMDDETLAKWVSENKPSAYPKKG